MEKLFTPVFAGGTGRSGTTIIVNLLSWHPEFHTSMPRGLVQGIELSVLDEAFRVFEVEYKKDVSNASRNFHYTLSSS